MKYPVHRISFSINNSSGWYCFFDPVIAFDFIKFCYRTDNVKQFGYLRYKCTQTLYDHFAVQQNDITFNESVFADILALKTVLV